MSMLLTDNLLELRKFVGPEFVFGSGAADLAGRYAENLGMNRVFVVSDPGVALAGWTEKVLDSLKAMGLETVLFDQVSPNPRDHEAMRGAEFYRSEGCDGIVAVGGGSPMDCAKAIGIVCANNQHVLEFEGVDNVPRPGPPLVCIPTTAGSSADVSQFAIINDTSRRVKIAIVSKTVVPDAALIDPVPTTTMDRELTRDTGLDALTHAVEAYVSNANGPVTDLFALEAVRLVAQCLPRAMDDPLDLEARGGQMMGSMLAGLAFSNAILGAVHALAHSLGGLLDLPHGQCNAILLDAVVDYNFNAEPQRYAAIGRALGAGLPPHLDLDKHLDEARQATLDALRSFKKHLGMDVTLSELGVRPEDLPALAEKAALDPCMATNPTTPDLDDLRSILEHAL